uniref:T9SS type A sorting domain-containing protein n=1 Tax=candidate division WOR-3 bacterium TaxID=2052148 RepID=A0A7V1EHH0_UNCW3
MMHILLIVSISNIDPDNYGFLSTKINENHSRISPKGVAECYYLLDSLYWDFETSDGGFSAMSYGGYHPGGWRWTNSMPWTGPHSGEKAWFMTSDWFLGYYENFCSWMLESPLIVLDSAGACTISFYHWYKIEYWYDGGNLKISTDYGTTWMVIQPSEPPVYPCPSAHSGNFGIPNEPCFSGDSSNLGWHQAKFSLDTFAGKVIKLRWHFGSADDVGVDLGGWYIDDVKITNATGITRDIGIVRIIKPWTNVIPNIELNPTISYQNFGNRAETLWVYVRIDSSGTLIYKDSMNIAILPQTETTAVFQPWHVGNNLNINYEMHASIIFPQDQYPFNDTITLTINTANRFWEILPKTSPIPSSGHSLATINDGYYMVFGIHTPGEYQDTTLIYDIQSDNWLGGPKNPFGPASFGTVNAVNRRYYRIGGTYDFPVPLNRVDIYDPISGLWSSGNPAPVGLIDHSSGVYKDSLIYVFGNGNWCYPTSNQVLIYDTYTNIWHSSTPFPSEGRGACAGGIIDSFIIIACGFKEGGIFCKDYIIGKINKDNPALITWNQWVTIPVMASGRCRMAYTVDNFNKELWLIGGKLNDNTESGQVFSYSPYTNTWTNWNFSKPHPVSNVSPVVAAITSYGDFGIFVPSGYYSNTYLREHEFLHISNNATKEISKKESVIKNIYLQCFPNPSTRGCRIEYTTSAVMDIQLKIYDISGRIIKTLIKRKMEPPGRKIIYWDGCDENGMPASSGVYFIKIESIGHSQTSKLVIM